MYRRSCLKVRLIQAINAKRFNFKLSKSAYALLKMFLLPISKSKTRVSAIIYNY